MPKPEGSHPDLPASIEEARSGLSRLDRQEWWRWVTVFVIMLLLTVGVFILSLPTFQRETVEQRDLNLAVIGLFGIVVIFDVFTVYQQIIISRLRRELTQQVAIKATLDMLKPPDEEALQGRGRQRKFTRFQWDQRICVSGMVNNKKVQVCGRTSDLSEGGVGAVIPESFALGTTLDVEVNLGPDDKLVTPAVVRQRRGFHHCLEFTEINSLDARRIREACIDAAQVVDWFQERTARTSH